MVEALAHASQNCDSAQEKQDRNDAARTVHLQGVRQSSDDRRIRRRVRRAVRGGVDPPADRTEAVRSKT